MKFFKQLTFARTMILLCLVGSAVLGYQVLQNREKITGLREALAEGGDVEELVREIQSMSKQYSELYDKRSDERLGGQDNPLTYIDRIASLEAVQIGRVEIDVTTREISNGIVDHIFSISPHDRETDYSRTHIANFLWSLEDQSRRVRVTDLKIEALDEAGKAIRKPHEYPSDRWKFQAKVTSRQRRDGAQ